MNKITSLLTLQKNQLVSIPFKSGPERHQMPQITGEGISYRQNGQTFLHRQEPIAENEPALLSINLINGDLECAGERRNMRDRKKRSTDDSIASSLELTSNNTGEEKCKSIKLGFHSFDRNLSSRIIVPKPIKAEKFIYFHKVHQVFESGKIRNAEIHWQMSRLFSFYVATISTS